MGSDSEFSNPIESEVRFRHFAHTMGSMLINKVEFMLSKRPVLRFAVTVFFHLHSSRSFCIQKFVIFSLSIEAV